MFRFTPKQTVIAKSTSRFKVVAAGRRFGKSRYAVEEICREASKPNCRVWYVAPTYGQAKTILWSDLQERLRPLRWIEKMNQTDMSIRLVNGSTITLKGADNFDSLRGTGLDHLVIDEPSDIHPDAWYKVLRPMVADRKGSVTFIGTPKGRNWFWELYQRGIDPSFPEYQSFHYTTLEGGNVTPDEIEEARRDLDELSFQQEFEASFVNFLGRAYIEFDADTHVRPTRYDPDLPLNFCFDFNVSPGVAVITQEQDFDLPSGDKINCTGVINEVYIPKNSNTLYVCNKLLELYGKHSGEVKCYGDASGGAAGSAKVKGSDWDLIKETLYRVYGSRLSLHVPKRNGPERARINAVNTRLRTTDGTIKLYVDPKCKYTIRDLEGVRLLEGGSGEIDKRHDPELTHLTDALGYYVVGEFPLTDISFQSGPCTFIGRW